MQRTGWNREMSKRKQPGSYFKKSQLTHMAEGHRKTAKVEEVKGGHSEQGTLQTNSLGNEKVMVGVGQHWRDFKDCCLGRWMALLNRQWTEEKGRGKLGCVEDTSSVGLGAARKEAPGSSDRESLRQGCSRTWVKED